MIGGELANDLVTGLPDGAFLVRWSISQLGKFAVTYNQAGKTVKSLIHNHGVRGCSFELRPTEVDLAPSIPALISKRSDLFIIPAVKLLQERSSQGDEDAAVQLVSALNQGLVL